MRRQEQGGIEAVAVDDFVPKKAVYLLNGLTVDLGLSIEELWKSVEQHGRQEVLHLVAKGLILIRLKLALPHGSFIPALAQRGIHEKNARNAMAAARFVMSQSIAHQERLLRLGVSKIYALCAASPAVVESLLSLDDSLERCGCRELGWAIKEEQAAQGLKGRWSAPVKTMLSLKPQVKTLLQQTIALVDQINEPSDLRLVQAKTLVGRCQRLIMEMQFNLGDRHE